MKLNEDTITSYFEDYIFSTTRHCNTAKATRKDNNRTNTLNMSLFIYSNYNNIDKQNRNI